MNVVRVHLQVGRFLEAADRPNDENLKTLGRLVTLAEETGLYLDVTGLGCYRKQDVPAWYDALDEAGRWEVQVRFWKEVAQVCRRSDAIFCYDLMNEPVLSGEGQQDRMARRSAAGKILRPADYDRRPGPERQGDRQGLGGKVDRGDPVGRRPAHDHGRRHPLGPGLQGGQPLFYSPRSRRPARLRQHPLLPQESADRGIARDPEGLRSRQAARHRGDFPWKRVSTKRKKFIRRSGSHVDGWVSFYWGKTPEESEKKGDLPGTIIAQWLRRFGKLAASVPLDRAAVERRD